MARQSSPVGRIDRMIGKFEKLQHDAQIIFDAHIDELRLDTPGQPFGLLKALTIAQPAGSTLNYVAALRLLREKILEREQNEVI